MMQLIVFLYLVRYVCAVNFDGCIPYHIIDPGESEISQCAKRIMKAIEFSDNGPSVMTFVNSNGESISTKDMGPKRTAIMRKFYSPNMNINNQFYVIHIRHIDELAEGLKNLSHEYYWNPNAKFIITVQNYIKDIGKFFSVFLIHNVYDVIIIGRLEYRGVSGIYTYVPFKNKSCSNPISDDVRLLSNCTNIDVKWWLSQKIKVPMIGCTFKFITHHYSPFINSKESKHSGEGIDQFLLNVLAQTKEFKYELIDYGLVEKFGKVLDNYTYTGMLNYIQRDVVDGAVGGYILQWNRAIGLDFLYPYLSDHVVIVLPRARLMDKWQAIGMQFKYSNMILILTAYVVFSLTSFGFSVFTKSKKSIVRDFVIVFGYFCNNISMLYLNRAVRSRIVLWNIIIFVMFIACAVQTSLLSSCTRPMRAYQIDSFDEVIDKKYDFTISPAMVHYIQSFYQTRDLDRLDKILNDPSCKTTLECLIEVKKKGKIYTISSELYLENSIWELADDHGNVLVHEIKSPLSYCWQTIYFRKGFPFIDELNIQVNRIVASGILRKHVYDLEYEERLKHRFRSESAHVPINMGDIRYIFVTLAMGWGISFFVLICEFIVYRRHAM